MIEDVTSQYKEVYHYTSAAGLYGIIKDKQIWATHISYLNDYQEFDGFFNDRMLSLIVEGVDRGLKELKNDSHTQSFIKESGGFDKLKQIISNEMQQTFRKFLIRHNEPYVVSFCRTNDNYSKHNGLLSQWRGYGSDGGYAIVFDTAEITKLLEIEAKENAHQNFFWCDVEYFNAETHTEAGLPESHESEQTFIDVVLEFVKSKSEMSFFPLHEPFMRLACSHKHIGFSEEQEIRIVFTPLTEEMIELSKNEGDLVSKKTIHFRITQNGLIPYIRLFDSVKNESLKNEIFKKSITKVIVGPHINSELKRRAVQMLLKENRIDAEVLVSEIPYLSIK